MPDMNGDISSPEEAFLPDSRLITTDPEALSTAPPTAGAPTIEERDDGVSQIEFDDRHRLDYDGLLYLGSLSHIFRFAGHEFKVRTLNTDEILEVGLLTQRWSGTMSAERAYVTAMVAAALISVDGQYLPQPITRDSSESRLSTQFAFIKGKYFPQVVDFVYQCILVLESRVDEILLKMGEASGQTD